MFEKATVVSLHHPDGGFDLGRLLDAMLYYQSIEFLVDGRSFPHLWRSIGPAGLSDLLSHPSLDAKITPEVPAVANKNQNGVVTHTPVFMTSVGHGDKIFDEKDTSLALAFMIDRNQANALRAPINKIVRRVGETRFGRIFSGLGSKQNMFNDLVSDLDSLKIFLCGYAAKHGAQLNVEVLNRLTIDTYMSPEGLVILSNYLPNQIMSKGAEGGWQDILPLIHDYQLDLYFSQARSADIVCGEVNASISAQRLDLSINRSLRSQATQTAFEQLAFGEARPFGDAFRDGRIDLSTALKTIDETRKFREWLTGIPVDADLIVEYHKAINKDTWLDKLPGKTSRFALFTGGGAFMDIMMTGGLGTVAGVTLSAFDSFVLDGLVKGWRPSNFVDKISEVTRQ